MFYILLKIPIIFMRQTIFNTFYEKLVLYSALGIKISLTRIAVIVYLMDLINCLSKFSQGSYYLH